MSYNKIPGRVRLHRSAQSLAPCNLPSALYTTEHLSQYRMLQNAPALDPSLMVLTKSEREFFQKSINSDEDAMRERILRVQKRSVILLDTRFWIFTETDFRA